MPVSVTSRHKRLACVLLRLLGKCLCVGQNVSTSPVPSGEPDLQEIVVTATRREETLGRVPMSVSALSQDQMDVQGVRRVDDIALLTPGVTFTHGAGANGGSGQLTQIAIRGIQSSVGA